MTTNFLELATTLKYLGVKWLPEKKVNYKYNVGSEMSASQIGKATAHKI